MFKWAIKTRNYRFLFDTIKCYADLKLTKNFWKEHVITIKYNDRKMNIRFFGGLSMLKEFYKGNLFTK